MEVGLSIASIVKGKRSYLGWTQKKLSEIASVSTPAVSRLENGEGCSGLTVAAVMKALGVSEQEYLDLMNEAGAPDDARCA